MVRLPFVPYFGGITNFNYQRKYGSIYVYLLAHRKNVDGSFYLYG